MELQVYPKVFVWTALCVAIATSQINFSAERQSHRVNQLSRTKQVTVARLSNYRQFKNEILKPILRERVAGTAGNAAVQRHIKGWMANLGWHVEEDRFEDTTPLGVKQFNNIIASHDINARRFLVLACHFDSKYFPDIQFIGATDSAVPCAMIMSLAQTLNSKLARKGSEADSVSLQLIFFDGEEAFKKWKANDSLYGSRHLAAKWENTPHPQDPNSNRLQGIDAFVLLDLIGAANPTFRNFFPQMTNSLFNELRRIESDLHNARQLRSHPRRNHYFSSSGGGQVDDDHVPFLQRGVPILHLISYPFPDVWHTERDDASAIHHKTVKNLNKILRVFVAEYLHLTV